MMQFCVQDPIKPCLNVFNKSFFCIFFCYLLHLQCARESKVSPKIKMMKGVVFAIGQGMKKASFVVSNISVVLKMYPNKVVKI